MKKILFVLFIVSMIPFFTAAKEVKLQNPGISKYAVIEIAKDYAPLRTAPDENAPRFSDLRKGTVIYADKKGGSYYRIDYGADNYLWLDKKYADVQAIIPEKLFPVINKVTFDESRDYYNIKIPLYIQTSYKATETANGIKFELYDIKYDKNSVYVDNKISKKSGAKFTINVNRNNSVSYNFESPHKIAGYDVIRQDKGIIFKVKKPFVQNNEKPLRKVKIALDAGHGGDETGVWANGLNEKDINLKITKYLNHELRKRGAKTYLTRKWDKNVDLYQRVDFAKEKDADILISIHQNSLPNQKDYAKRHGTGTYYYFNQAKPLASAIQKNLVLKTGFKDDGIHYASFVITRATMPVSVLVECGYLIHPYEAKMLNDKKFQKIVASAIADGVEEYLRNLK